MSVPSISDADAWLVDDRWSKAYALAGEIHIGRGADSSIILRDPVISRRHASVKKEGDAYVLHAYGTAGTRVNGEEIRDTCVLSEGDRIEIAFTCLRYTMVAPTGEMFVVARDTPTTLDHLEGPTRATVRAAVVRQRPFWASPLFLAGALILLIAITAILFGVGAE